MSNIKPDDAKKLIVAKIKAFRRQLILVFVAGFIVFAQFVNINDNFDFIWTWSFWLNVLTNWAILSIIYTVYQSEGIEDGLASAVYLATVGEFEKLYLKIVGENHISKIEHYADLRNEEIRRMVLTDLLVGTGVQLKDFCCKYEHLSKKELKKCAELASLQIEKLIKIKKIKITFDKISLNELAINNNKRTKSAYDESFSYDEKAIKAKLLALRLVKAAIWAVAFSSVILTAKDTVSIFPLITWVLMKASAIYWAVTGGLKDGKYIILGIKRTCFTKKITFMQRYFEWNTAGAKELEQFKPIMQQQKETVKQPEAVKEQSIRAIEDSPLIFGVSKI